MKKSLFVIIALIFSIGLNAQSTLSEAPDFTATDYFGNEIHLYEILDGGQYVLLHINTRTNAATPTVTPPLVEAYTKLGCNMHDVFFIGIVPNGTTNITKKYVEEYGIEFPMIHNTDESNGMTGPAMDIWRTYNCDMPTTMLIAPDKAIVLKDIGKIEIYEDITTALAQYGIEEHSCEEEQVQLPEKPMAFATAVSDTSIVVTWNVVVTATSYSLYQGTDIIAANLNDTTFTVTELSPKTEYCFAVTAVNEAGESESSDEVCDTTLSGEGLDEIVLDVFMISPNPATTEITITSEMNGEADINIYDMTGRCVKNVRVADISNARINITDINKGVYFVDVNGRIKKFIVK